MTDISIVILAAGKGTRMKSDLPKVLHKMCGKPLLSFVLDAVKDISDEKPYVIIGYQSDKVIDLFKGRGVNFILQKEQLGTGHALMQAEPMFNGKNVTILVLNGDMPLITNKMLEDLIAEHRSRNASASVLTAMLEAPSGYGRIVKNGHGDLEKIVEQKDGSLGELEIKEINTGTYCFESADLFKSLNEIRPENAQHEYYLTDVIAILKKNGKKVSAFCAGDPSAAIGINTIEQLKEAERIFKCRQ